MKKEEPSGVGPTETRMSRAFARLLPRMREIPRAEVLHINLDVSLVIKRALAAWPKVRSLRNQLKAGIIDLDFDLVDLLEECALALQFAQSEYLTVVDSPVVAPELLAEASAIRTVLLAEVRVLVLRGAVQESQLESLSGSVGYSNVAMDVTVLARLLQRLVQAGQVRVNASEQELQHALQVADGIFREAGRRDKVSLKVQAAAAMRARAYTLLVNAYQEARAGIQFIRRKRKDAEKFMPSLFAKRSRVRAKASPARAARV